MFRQLDDRTLVSGQIGEPDIAEAKRLGVTMIVNNRPDEEDPAQPPNDLLEAAARAAGIAYRHVPIARGLGPAHVTAMHEAMREAGDGKLLAFCRSGNRSTLAWALARREDGVPREELEKSAEGAGYSLAAIGHLL